jgi:hypothetical protein
MDRARFLRGSSLNGRAAAALAVVVVCGGCITDVAPPRQTIWETLLAGGPEHPYLSGRAAAVSGGTSTEASVSIVGADAGTYRWGVFRGECADPGDILGSEDAYPALSVGTPGEGTADAAVPRPMRSDRTYYVQVRTADDVQVACGDFVLWQ